MTTKNKSCQQNWIQWPGDNFKTESDGFRLHLGFQRHKVPTISSPDCSRDCRYLKAHVTQCVENSSADVSRASLQCVETSGTQLWPSKRSERAFPALSTNPKRANQCPECQKVLLKQCQAVNGDNFIQRILKENSGKISSVYLKLICSGKFRITVKQY